MVQLQTVPNQASRKRFSLRFFLLIPPLLLASVSFCFWYEIRYVLDKYWFERDLNIQVIENLAQLKSVLVENQKILLSVDYPYSFEAQYFKMKLQDSETVWYHPETRGYRICFLKTKNGFWAEEDKPLLAFLESIPDAYTDPYFRGLKRMKTAGVIVMISDGKKSVFDGLYDDKGLYKKIADAKNLHLSHQITGR